MSKEGNPQDPMVDLVMGGGSDNYFEDLEKEVNPAIYDDAQTEEQVTPEEAGTEATQDSMEGSDAAGDWESDDNPYKKRYSDSSRENAKNQKFIEENSQYASLIDVMKKDPGLLNTVKGYLEGDKTPKNEIPEDFIFDADEAFADPNSTSGKIFTNAVRGIVNNAVSNTEKTINNRIEAEKQEQITNAEAEKWMKENNMSQEEFVDMMNRASKHTISYDDMNLILNKDQVKRNVAKNTKKDVIDQMKNVRKTTQTVSGTGSADVGEITAEDQVFNMIKGLEEEDLYG